jgi:hypothetical protein
VSVRDNDDGIVGTVNASYNGLKGFSQKYIIGYITNTLSKHRNTV